MTALAALCDSTGCDLHDLDAVASIDPHAIRAVLELFTSAGLAVAQGEGDAEVRARIVALLDQLATIRARAAARRWAA